MNSLEYKMVGLLKDMVKNYAVVAVKAELEAEGLRINELMRLKEIAQKADLGIVLKIGGAEAVTDLLEAQKLGVSGIAAPMIESPYAMKKYISLIQRCLSQNEREDLQIIAMIETVQGYKNTQNILEANIPPLVDTIGIGRVDLSGSLGFQHDQINHPKIYKIAEEISTAAKKKGLKTVMGGGIAKEAIPFIKKLVAKKLLDRFETRKIVFQTDANISNTQMEEGIIKANLFELFWLQNKKKYYTNIYLEDDSRIEMLMSRIYKIKQ